MKTLPFFASAALVALTAAGGAAIAQGPGGPGHGGWMKAIMMADTNKDGKLSRAEATAGADAAFARMDVNKDGKIDAVDRAAMHQQRSDMLFGAMDANKDGVISRAEFDGGFKSRMKAPLDADKQAKFTARLNERFAAIDANKDGNVTRAEYDSAMSARGDRADRRGGEGKQRPEMTAASMRERSAQMFDRMDANKDGFVTTDEMKAAMPDRMRGRPGGHGEMPPPPAGN